MTRLNTLFAALAAFSISQSSATIRTHHRGSALPERPNITPAPYGTGQESPYSPPRDEGRYCYVQPGSANGTTRDDAPGIFKAFEDCNDGGTVVLDQSYLISSPLDLTFLQHVDIVITGEVAFDDSDVYYWARNSFKYDFQNMSSFWKIGGEDINIYGDLSNNRSVIDGRGQTYWEELSRNSTLLRPMLLVLEGVKGATMSNLRMRNPPNWFNMIANATDVIISNMDLIAASTGGVKIANSDGWDTYRSDRVVIQDSVIINTDDCVSFKPNSTNVVVQNLDCTGSHGISVGSLGQYKGQTDIVENLYIYNISMADASDAARIKVWPGVETAFQDLLNGGGGLGRVRNVTYDTFYHDNNDRAITITQCYGQKNQTLCNEFPVCDAGLYSFFIMWPTPQLSMNYMFAPNHTLQSYYKVVGTFFEFLEANNITLSLSHQAMQHTSFYSAYQATWGANNFPVGVDTSLPANRLVPRRNFVEKYEETYALIKSHVSSGKHFLGYHNAPSNAAPTVANQNNAVNPAFREMVFFLVTSSNRSADHSSPAGLAAQNKYLQEQVLQPWRDIAPVSEGGGTYLNEASVEEVDWQESFYGGYYHKLSEIKRKWDPNEVFYAVTAVGSERWKVQDGN